MISSPLPLSIRRGAKLDGKLANWESGRVKTTLELPDDLVRRMKIRAVQERRPLKRLVAELLNQGLNASSAPNPAPPAATSRVTVAENGFPVFRCTPKAAAKRMSAKELIALEQQTMMEEDARRAGLPL
jgi:plasmid stability protein